MSTPSLSRLPLCVDLDDTLILTDSFFLQVKQLLARQPWRLGELLLRFLKGGRPAAKAWLCEMEPLEARDLPYRHDLVTYLREQRQAGRALYLVSAANQKTVARVADYLNFFDGAFGSDETHNLKGRNKAAFIREKIGADFVYAGDTHADLAVWKESRGAILCGKATAFQAGLGVPIEICFPDPRS